MDRFNGIKTRADAQAYAQDVVAKAKTAQANRAQNRLCHLVSAASR